MPDTNLRDRLRRLGLKPLRDSQPPPGLASPPVAPPRAAGGAQSLQDLVPGREVETAWGASYLVEAAYPVDYRHAGGLLDDFRLRSPATAAALAREPALADLPLESLIFVDTETTGLAGGAGTFAFLIGLGYFTEKDFVLRQYFLRDPAEEAAMLGAFMQDCAGAGGWISFNGKAFDLPLIQNRYRLAHRARSDYFARPHLDLLFPARRLYRSRLPSCSLGTIESAVFDLQRTEEDVPGWLIPQLYLDYLATGDARRMRSVLYHNAVDVLSMVTLAAHLLDVFARPAHEIHKAEDHLALALWHEAAGRLPEAERAYRAAVRGHLRDEEQFKAHSRYAAFLKRQGRRAEAVEHWEALFTLAPREFWPPVELAKYFEWEAGDPATALGWARVALKAAGRRPGGWQRDEAVNDLRHRVARLERKAAEARAAAPSRNRRKTR
jgi:uncharacterized protein YprB with RNaseH-like and TPR domain